MRLLMRLCATVVLWGAVASGARAAAFTDMYVFGDSLVDTGNVSLLTGGLLPDPTQPYAPGRFSNGLLWVDYLAAGLGLPDGATPFLAGGNNYAFAGARTGADLIPPGLLLQAGLFHGLTNPAADPNALYVVTAGGNDLRDARAAGSTAASRQAAAEAAAGNVLGAVATLIGQGVRHILLTNAPDLGLTPEASELGLVAESTDVSLRYNAILGVFEGLLEPLIPGLDLDLLDLFGWSSVLYHDAVDNGGALFGLTNATTPCAGFAGSTGISCDVSVFSDNLHPSAKAHALFGFVALDMVQGPMVQGPMAQAASAPMMMLAAADLEAESVPEPATALLLGLAVPATLALRRRRAPQG